MFFYNKNVKKIFTTPVVIRTCFTDGVDVDDEAILYRINVVDGL